MTTNTFARPLRTLGEKIIHVDTYIGEVVLLFSALFIAMIVVWMMHYENFFPLIRRIRRHFPWFIEPLRTYGIPLFSPFLFTLILIIFGAISNETTGSSEIISTFSRIAFAWFLLRLLVVGTQSYAIGVFVGILVYPSIILESLSLLDPTLDYLDKIAFKLGTIKLSLLTIGKGIVVSVLFVWITNLISQQIQRLLKRFKSLKPTSREMLSKLLTIGLYVIAFFVGLQLIGVDLTAFAVFGGAVGVGVGFGLQKITSNFISGLILVFEKSIRIGDLLELQNGVNGWVRHMGGRYLLVETTDGREVMVPNEELIANRVTNWTYSNTRARVEVPVSVAYGSDLEKAKKLMLDAARECDLCVKDPEPVCFIQAFGASGIDLLLHFWVKDVSEGRMGPRSDVMMLIWKKFQKHKIEIPFPQQEVRLLEK